MVPCLFFLAIIICYRCLSINVKSYPTLACRRPRRTDFVCAVKLNIPLPLLWSLSFTPTCMKRLILLRQSGAIPKRLGKARVT